MTIIMIIIIIIKTKIISYPLHKKNTKLQKDPGISCHNRFFKKEKKNPSLFSILASVELPSL